MIRVLAVSRVYLDGEYRCRFLCIRSSIDINKARMMMSQVPYPCYDVQQALLMFNKDDIYFADYILDGVGVLTNIPLVQVTARLKVAKIRNYESFVDTLGKYNPSLMQMSFTQLGDYFKYLPCGWLYLNDVPLCIWKPIFKDSSVVSHFSLQGDVLVYKYEKNIYILTDENVRHRPATLGEFLSVNVVSLECIRYVRSISSDNIFTERSYYYDKVLREWVLLRETERVTVLGMKAR